MRRPRIALAVTSAVLLTAAAWVGFSVGMSLQLLIDVGAFEPLLVAVIVPRAWVDQARAWIRGDRWPVTI